MYKVPFDAGHGYEEDAGWIDELEPLADMVEEDDETELDP